MRSICRTFYLVARKSALCLPSLRKLSMRCVDTKWKNSSLLSLPRNCTAENASSWSWVCSCTCCGRPGHEETNQSTCRHGKSLKSLLTMRACINDMAGRTMFHVDAGMESPHRGSSPEMRKWTRNKIVKRNHNFQSDLFNLNVFLTQKSLTHLSRCRWRSAALQGYLWSWTSPRSPLPRGESPASRNRYLMTDNKQQNATKPCPWWVHVW